MAEKWRCHINITFKGFVLCGIFRCFGGKNMYDIAVIGGGVVGSLIAKKLSEYNISGIILEKEADVSMGTSKANSAIVHAGYDAMPGTLIAKLNVKGSEIMENLCKELHVPYKKIGSMVIATDDHQKEHLLKLLKYGITNNVKGIKMISGDEAREIEPNLNEEITYALYAPSAAIICPYELNIAAAEIAIINGFDIKLNYNVCSIEKRDNFFTIKNAADETINAKYIVNAAGLHSDEIASLLGPVDFFITPRRGEYMIMDKIDGDFIKSIIFQTPTIMGKGVLVAPTVDGNIFAGPTAENIDDKTDKATTRLGLDSLIDKAHISVPKLNFKNVIKSFTGLRASVYGYHDFIINNHPKSHRFINVAGICSPGLSAAPAIAEYTTKLLKESGMKLNLKSDFTRIREKEKPFREMNDKERAEAIQNNPLHGKIICRCETATAAEIIDAIHSPIPCITIDGIKRRARAGMGRCQGGFCMPKVLELIHQETGLPYEEITKFGGDSKIVYSRLKNRKDLK